MDRHSKDLMRPTSKPDLKPDLEFQPHCLFCGQDLVEMAANQAACVRCHSRFEMLFNPQTLCLSGIRIIKCGEACTCFGAKT